MAPPLNRIAIYLNLAAFVGLCLFCIITQAPAIQQDVLKRCHDVLSIRGLPSRGLSVNGRDVELKGTGNSPITTARVVYLLSTVPGVRMVTRRFVSGTGDAWNGFPTGPQSGASYPGAINQQEAEARIRAVVNREPITFRPGTAILSPAGEQSLDQVAAVLAQVPNLSCQISAQDTHLQEDRHSWVLALQRALAAEDYLQSRGIPEWRLSARAVQNERPQAAEPVIDLTVNLTVRAK